MPRESDSFAIRGLDLTTPGHQLPSGACRLLWGLVPTGRGEGAVWEVPKMPEQRGTADSILSLGWQRRSSFSRFADLDGDPDQSLHRLIALKADGLYVIDPGQSYTEKQIYNFDEADDTRRASFSGGEQVVHVSITSGDGVGTPETSLLVHGDTVAEYKWPALPEMAVSLNSESGALSQGTYLFRFAWRLDDGSLGPAGSLIEKSVVGEKSVNAKVRSFNQSLPDYWRDRISELAMIGHAPVTETDSDGNTTEKIPGREQPGYIIGGLSTIKEGFSVRFTGTKDDLLSRPVYDGSAIQHHTARAGANYRYNARLFLGDIEYDFLRPPIKKILRWEDGRENSGGNDVWVLLAVTIQTTDGQITRYSVPLPFDSSSATSASVPSGLIWYPDSRASGWELYQSTDYSAGMDVADATWNALFLPGVRRSFEDSAGGAFVYNVVKSSLDLTEAVATDPTLDVGYITNESDWTGDCGAGEKWTESDVPEGEADSKTVTEDSEFSESQVIAESQDVTRYDVDYVLEVEVETDGGNDEVSATAEILVEVLDDNKNVLESKSNDTTRVLYGQPDNDTGNLQNTVSETFTLDDFDAKDAEFLRIKNDATVNIDNNTDGSKVYARSQSSANQANDVTAYLTSYRDTTRSFDGTENEQRSTRPDLIVWSSPYRPMERDAENVVSGSRSSTDRVLALQAVGQEVSEGQFGQYPILSLQKDSVRVLRVGDTDPIIQRVDVLTNDMGVVGRRAVASADGPVVACLEGGLYALEPELRQPSLSSPLNDINEEFLQSIGPDTVVGHYKDVERGRNDVWLAAGGRTWAYSIDQGAWSSLRRGRRDYSIRPDDEYGVRADGTLVQENAVEGEGRVNIQTAVLQLGPLGTIKRMREVQLRQPEKLEEITLHLIATDPEREYVKLGDNTLSANEVQEGLVLGGGLGTGFVVDVRGTGRTGQSIESMFVEWDVRNRRVRDHQPHEYPAYLDTPEAAQTTTQDDDVSLVQASETEETVSFVLVSTNDL